VKEGIVKGYQMNKRMTVAKKTASRPGKGLQKLYLGMTIGVKV
jgi:hypothetical protein